MFKKYIGFGFVAGSFYGIAHLIAAPIKQGLTLFEHYSSGLLGAVVAGGSIGAVTGLLCALCAIAYHRFKQPH